jgi:hypothetical protein
VPNARNVHALRALRERSASRRAPARSKPGSWACSSAWLERTPDKREVGSSSLPRPTILRCGAGYRPPANRRGRSSVGRAPALQAGGRRFDPVRLHQIRRQAAGGERRSTDRPAADESPSEPREKLFRRSIRPARGRWLRIAVARLRAAAPRALCYCEYDVVRTAVRPAALRPSSSWRPVVKAGLTRGSTTVRNADTSCAGLVPVHDSFVIKR